MPCVKSPKCPELTSLLLIPLLFPAITEFMLPMKLLKHGLCSADGEGDDLGSLGVGEFWRLCGDALIRLAVSANLSASSDFTDRPLAFPSALLFLFLLKLPLSNIFSQLGSKVQ